MTTIFFDRIPTPLRRTFAAAPALFALASGSIGCSSVPPDDVASVDTDPVGSQDDALVGTGKHCNHNAQCKSRVCRHHTCQASTCSDGVKNGGETGVDCGDPCAPCAGAAACTPSGDCTGVLKTATGKAMDGFASIDAPRTVQGPDGIQNLGAKDGDPTTACVPTEARTDHGLLFKEAHWQLAGPGIDAGKTYHVTVHLTGVVECKTYTSLAACTRAPFVDRNAEYNLWCPGATDPAASSDHFNTMMLSVTPTSSATTPNVGPQNLGPLPTPGHWWTFNECPANMNESHQTWKISHDATIDVPAGSWINFVEFDTNCREIINCGQSTDSSLPCTEQYQITPPGAVPAPPSSITSQPAAGGGGGFGQWVYFDVKTVTPI